MNSFPFNSRLMKLVFTFALAALFTGCTPSLIVRDLEVDWGISRKEVVAEISNIGNTDADEFQVYFIGDEIPVIRNDKPQTSQSVPMLAKGTSIILKSDFEPMARSDNNYLGDVYRITVLIKPKKSNAPIGYDFKVSLPVYQAESKFDFNVLAGGASVAGYGTQNSSGNHLGFSVDLDRGWAVFDEDLNYIFSGPTFPPSLIGTSIELSNGTGRYDINSGKFSYLTFDVKVTDIKGNVSTSTHKFSGNTTAPLKVPVGSSPPIDVRLQISLASPDDVIDLGAGLSARIDIGSAKLISAYDLP